MQAYTHTLHTTQRESNLTTTMFHNIPTFHRHDSKLQDWFMDIETITDILTESCMCLAEAKSSGLTCMLIHEATTQESVGMKSRESLDWNSVMQISIPILHTLWRYNNETLAAYTHCFKMAAKWCSFHNDSVAICIFVKGLRDAPTITAKTYEKDPHTLAEVTILVEKLSEAHQLTAILIPFTVSMSGDERWFFCRGAGNFGCNCPDAQHYDCDALLFHPPQQFMWPFGWWIPLLPSHCDTDRHSCSHHFSHRHQSHHSIDWSQSHLINSHHTAQESQPRKTK